MPLIVQQPSIILPTVWILGTEVETIDVADITEHTSLELFTKYLGEKMVYITATEVVGAGAPGPLWAWIELSPVLSTISAAYWSAIGGGGGAMTSLAPLIEVGVGVNGRVHGFMLAWSIHSEYARLVVQTPVASATAGWVIQAIFAAKTM